MQSYYDTIIIGAGASGLFCAMTLAKQGNNVLVLDHANKAGKKILMSGGGKCNFTNYNVMPEHYLCQNPHFVKSALSGYSQWDFLALVNAHGIAIDEKEHGQLFCQQSANDILQMLLSNCQRFGVHIRLNQKILSIQSNTANSNKANQDKRNHHNHFTLKVQSQKHGQSASPHFLHCQALIIATGGLSIPSMGATGFGYQIAEQFGHRIIPTVASLVPFTFTDHIGEQFQTLSGISIDVIAFNDKISFALPILFTHRGLSGPASLQLSNYWQLGESIYLNLLPNVDVATSLLKAKQQNPRALVMTIIAQLSAQQNKALPKKLLGVLQTLLFDDIAKQTLANIKDDRLIQLGQSLNAWQLKPAGSEGYRTAEVTKGGIDTQDVSSKTLESQLMPNLYFIGEVLDVTGWLGGYNFQWAWASAFACAKAILQPS